MPGAGRRVPSAERRVPSAECRVPSAECRVPSVQWKVGSFVVLLRAETQKTAWRCARRFLFEVWVLLRAAEFAADEHEGLADTWGKAAVGLHGEERAALADELDRHGAGVEFDRAAGEAEVGEECLDRVHCRDVLLVNLGDLADAWERAGALEDFLVGHFPINAEDGAELELLD